MPPTSATDATVSPTSRLEYARGALPDVDPGRLPRHIAIIMDGNGRWAQERGLPRALGHRAGAKSVRTVLEECGRLGVRALTLYSFSSENWKRPADEVEALMALYRESLLAHRQELIGMGVRFRQIGRRAGIPEDVLAEVRATEEATRGGGRIALSVAINYGGRAEIADAARALAERVARGELSPASIDEAAFEAELSTHGLPELDLMIRTAGELRVSNFLLWQLSYAELHVTETLWPDFGVAELHAAIRDFAGRRRRFGGLDAGEDAGAGA